jgi:hypothetical protein
VKRVLWVVAAIGLVAGAHFVARPSDAEVVENARSALVAGCARRGAAGSPVPPDRIDAFCGCAAGRVVAELGPDRLRAIADDPGAFDAARMAALSVECFHEVVDEPTPDAAVDARSQAMPPPTDPTSSAPMSATRSGGAKRAQPGRPGGMP